MGSAITAIKFPYFLTDKERYNSLDYFRMGIIEEIRFALFKVEDTARNKKLCAEMMRKLKSKVRGLQRKVKIYLRHSQKNSKYYTCLAFFNGKFRTQLNIRDRAFLLLG